MIEFLKQLFTFLSGLSQYWQTKTLIKAGEDKQKFEQSEKILDHVQKAYDIRASSGNRTDNFFVRPPDSQDK